MLREIHETTVIRETTPEKNIKERQNGKKPNIINFLLE